MADYHQKEICRPFGETLVMADYVHAVLERQLPELEDLREHGIFTEAEIREIATKRRDFEYLLKRRAPRRVDFIRYIKYEMDLDEDRKQRKAALGIRKSLKSDYGCQRHVHFIFDRLLRRFPSDMDAWRQYVEFCSMTGAGKSLSEVFGRVLRLHPHSVEFWVRAASHELYEIGSMDGARLLMQRGLRVNRDSKDLWLAYFKLELDCLSKVKAQRALLGISASPDDTSSSEPSVVGIPGSSEAPLAAEADVLAAAESDFLKGAVARIVHAHAVKEIPNDVEFELRFAEVAAQARDTSTKESRVARALLVPSLLDDIVLRCKARYPEEPALWAFLATHATSVPLTAPHTAPTPSKKKRRASSVVEDDSEFAMARRVFEQGLAVVPEAKHTELLRRFLSYVKPHCGGPQSEMAIETAIQICDKLSLRIADVSVASLHCTLLAGRGDLKSCVAVSERLVAALPKDPQAWLLLADMTEAATAASLPAVLAVLDRGLKHCAPLLALGDPANKAKLEPLWRRRIEAQLAQGSVDPVGTDFKTAVGYGMLTSEAKLFSVLSK